MAARVARESAGEQQQAGKMIQKSEKVQGDGEEEARARGRSSDRGASCFASTAGLMIQNTKKVAKPMATNTLRSTRVVARARRSIRDLGVVTTR